MQRVLDHYGTASLLPRITSALADAGLADGPIPWRALAPLDQFHIGGIDATTAFAEKLGLGPQSVVLDLGCGLGGPARQIAATYGCAVTGVDLSPAFVELALELTRRTGLSDKVQHREADATALPFEDASFDVVWTQHVAMNIADRDRLYQEIARVLRRGGRLAAYDVVLGAAGPLHFPVPWAREPATSFVVTPGAMRRAIEQAGFTQIDEQDATAEGVRFFAEQAAARAAGTMPPAMGLPLVMGADFPALVANLARNLAEGRAGVIQLIARKPD